MARTNQKFKPPTSKPLPWTPFQEMNYTFNKLTGEEAEIPKGVRIFKNNRYMVFVRLIKPVEPFGRCVYLSIKRNDQEPIHDWRDLQRIKNELVGPEVEAIELYPAESRLVDEANQFHLWCFPEYKIPYGQRYRQVGDEHEAAKIGAKQRPFER